VEISPLKVVITQQYIAYYLLSLQT